MLTISIYKNVPLQASYANVVLFNDASDVLAYLEPYKEGETTTQKFFGNETTIDLTPYYEGCNYMAIYDNRSNKPYKFFFIENAQFISGGAVRYSIILDAWTTYSYNITFKNSRMISGHLDTQNVNNIKRYLIGTLNGASDFSMQEYLTRKWDDVKQGTLIAVVSYTSSFGTGSTIGLWFSKIISESDFHDAINCIGQNRYRLSNISPVTWQTYTILNLYYINDFDLKYKLDNIDEDISKALYGSNLIIADDIEPHTQWYNYLGEGKKIIGYEADDTPIEQIIYYDNLKININTKQLFSASTYNDKSEKIKHRYRVGTLTNSQEIIIDSEFNNTMELNLYIFNRYQILIYLKCDTISLNLTNEFQIPFVNDSYTLYMAQNQATIEANNRSTAIAMLSSIGMGALGFGVARATGGATAGASIMAGAQQSSTLLQYATQFDKMQARLKDAGVRFDRIDAQFSAGLMTNNFGVGLIKYTYVDTYDVDTITNDFGFTFKYYTTTFKPVNASLYNFYFIQFDDINITGDFAQNIKSILQTIFTNGVRIWCDKSQYLNNVSYKK